jgi:hypothetical protein
MNGGGGMAAPAPQPQNNQFKAQNPAEHPFAPQRVGEIKDYSDNAKNLPAK